MVRDHLTAKGSEVAYLAKLHRDVLRWRVAALSRAKDQDKLMKTYTLETRTGWYNVLSAYAAATRKDAGHGGLAALRRTVDLNYNRKVAKSLGALTLREEEEDLELAAVLRRADLTVDFRHSAALFIDEESRANWLTWAEAERRLSEHPYPADLDSARERRMRELLHDRYAIQTEHGKLVLLVRRGIPFLMAGTAGTAAATTSHALGGSLGSSIAGGLLGAFAGAVLPHVVHSPDWERSVAEWRVGRLLRVTQPSAEAAIRVDEDPDNG